MQTFGGQALVEGSPRIRDARQRYRLDAVPELLRANSLTVTSGRWPSAAWLLMTRRNYDLLDKYSTNLQLVIDDLQNGQRTFGSLAIVQARCVTRGLADDPNAVYLIQATDGRGVLCNPWFDFGTTSQYNVTAPAYPDRYYSGSLNGSSAWTWDGMVGNLWTQMADFLGPYPGLPLVPTATPEGFIFPGVPAWEALCMILDLLGMTVACDLTQTNPFTIVSSGAEDTAFTTAKQKYLGRLRDDASWIDVGSGRVPGTVIVYFHTAYQYYGTEETVRRDSLQWSSHPVYSVSVASPSQFASASGTASVWDDFLVHLDVDGNPVAADVALAAVCAQDRVTEFFNKIYSGTSGYLSQTYAGALPFATGSQVDGVRWRQTRGEFDRLAWQTELSRGWVWNEVVFSKDPETIVGTRDDD